MKVKVIEEKCIACGACQMLAPDIFEVYDVAKVLKNPETDEEKQNVDYACIACPTQAIELIETLKKELSK